MVRFLKLLHMPLRFHFQPLAFGDIAQDHCKKLLPAHLDPRDRRFHGKLLTARAERAKRARGAHGAGGCARLDKAVHVLTMDLAKAFRDEPFHRVADGLGCRAAEDPLGRLVEEHDTVFGIGGDDGVCRRGDDAGEPDAAFFQLLLSVQTLGDVAQDDGEELLPADLGLRNGRLDREFLAIGAKAAEGAEMAHCAAGHTAFAELPQVLPMGLAEALRG